MAILFFISLPFRIHEGFFGKHFRSKKTIPKCLFTNSYFSRPHTYAHCFSKGTYWSIPACIVKLLCVCSPFTILRKISKIIIDSFNRMVFRWARSDISIKARKTIFPLLANVDSSSSISRIRLVCTSCFHLLPSFIFRSSGHPMSFSNHFESPFQLRLYHHGE